MGYFALFIQAPQLGVAYPLHVTVKKPCVIAAIMDFWSAVIVPTKLAVIVRMQFHLQGRENSTCFMLDTHWICLALDLA
jgi:hypothetical protein